MDAPVPRPTTPWQNQLDEWQEAASVVRHIRDPRVARSLGPAGVRGLLLHRGSQGVPTPIPAHHAAWFDWSYPHDQPELAELYRRARRGQWDAEDLPWDQDVDPLHTERYLLPPDFLNPDALPRGIVLNAEERQRLLMATCTWMLSQFLHGEQGALFASAQVTEAVPSFDGKLYGATQVMDEARHVEVFLRYLESKLGRLYRVNDNLYTIIDALMSDARWDMKFLGMQILIEGLALGAFGTMYQVSREPLLRELLRYVILDEARHVHYGVVALRRYFREELSESQRREREEWAFEVALLMRNRFMVYEVYEEWFEGRMSREQWRQFVLAAPGLERFRTVMFSRLMPNLRELGLVGPEVLPRYESAGLLRYLNGASADQMTGEGLIAELDRA